MNAEVIKYLTLLGTIISVISGFFVFVKWIYKKYKEIRDSIKSIEEKIIDNFPDCTYLLEPNLYKTFIDLMFQKGNNPDDKDDLQDGLSDTRQSLIKYFLNEVFIEKNKIGPKRRIFILAGSGMGKTTFTVHLLCEYLRKYRYKSVSALPFDIYRFCLDNGNVLQDIEEKSKTIKPDNTILLLDALDENINACKNYDIFIKELDKITVAFKYVIITCRNQFLLNDSAIFQDGVARNNGRNKYTISYERFYISPFSSDDVYNYLEKKYPLGSNDYVKARKLTDTYESLVTRPLLLCYLEDLLKSSVDSLSSARLVYENITREWIYREACSFSNDGNREIKEEQLLRLSKRIAVCIYENWKTYGNAAISIDDFLRFQKQYGFDEEFLHFRDRSLLNRRRDGYIKFSHKSFFEYFLALAALDDPYLSIDYNGLDTMYSIWADLVQNKSGEVICDTDNELDYLKQLELEFDSLKQIVANHSNSDDYEKEIYKRIDSVFDIAHKALYVLSEFRIEHPSAVTKFGDMLAVVEVIGILQSCLIELNTKQFKEINFHDIKSPITANFNLPHLPYENYSLGATPTVLFGPIYEMNGDNHASNIIIVRNIHSGIDYNSLISKYPGHLISFKLPYNTSIEQIETICTIANEYVQHEKKAKYSSARPLYVTIIDISAIIDGHPIEIVLSRFRSFKSQGDILNCINGKLKIANYLGAIGKC